MHMPKRLSAITALMLVIVACGGPIIEGSEDADGSATTVTTFVVMDADERGPVDSLTGVRSAVVRIVGQGTFADPMGGELANVPGSGSGFVIDGEGLALTNNHVVTGAAFLDVHVDGEDTPRSARVIAVSECSDLALIDIDGQFDSWLTFYDGEIEPGREVFAAGFPLGDPAYSLTSGVIARAPRPSMTQFASVASEVEHTAQSLPGSSGGPLVTSDGRVVAVHYAGRADTAQRFAIGRDEVLQHLDTLREGQDVTALGINGEAFAADDISGIFVYSVASGSIADRGGVRSGDLVTRLEGIDLAVDGTMDSYCRILRSHTSEDALSIQVFRPDTGELLEGTLNVDDGALAVRQAAMNDGSAAVAQEDTVTVANDPGTLSAQVPATWLETETGTWTLDGTEVGNYLAAAPDVDAFFSGWRVPGMFLARSHELVSAHSPSSLLEEFGDVGDGCEAPIVDDYDDGVYVGVYDSWTDCGGSATLFRVVTRTPSGQALVYLEIIVPDGVDLGVADLVASTFIALDTL